MNSNIKIKQSNQTTMETTENQKKNQHDEIVITDLGEVLNLREYDEAMAQFNEWYADQLAMQY